MSCDFLNLMVKYVGCKQTQTLNLFRDFLNKMAAIATTKVETIYERFSNRFAIDKLYNFDRRCLR